jgi:membrane protein DedA with SNARE-associated domain
VFTTFNILGAVLWTGVWGLGTYFLEKEITSLHPSFQKIEPWVAGFCVLSFLALLVYLLRHGRKKG